MPDIPSSVAACRPPVRNSVHRHELLMVVPEYSHDLRLADKTTASAVCISHRLQRESADSFPDSQLPSAPPHEQKDRIAEQVGRQWSTSWPTPPRFQVTATFRTGNRG